MDAWMELVKAEAPDVRVKLYSRDLESEAIHEARVEAEAVAQRTAEECRERSGVRIGHRRKVVPGDHGRRRNELNRNSARVARERQKAYTEALENKLMELENRLRSVCHNSKGSAL